MIDVPQDHLPTCSAGTALLFITFFHSFFSHVLEILRNMKVKTFKDIVSKSCCGTFLQQLECGYEFPALIHVWIAAASASVLEWFISTSGEATSACKPF